MVRSDATQDAGQLDLARGRTRDGEHGGPTRGCAGGQARFAASLSARGQRTWVAQPSFSKIQIIRALESI
jgi:hypothetical protein